jgi:hypothetical protein
LVVLGIKVGPHTCQADTLTFQPHQQTSKYNFYLKMSGILQKWQFPRTVIRKYKMSFQYVVLQKVMKCPKNHEYISKGHFVYFFCCCFLVVLGIKLRASCMEGKPKQSKPELHSCPQQELVYFLFEQH